MATVNFKVFKHHIKSDGTVNIKLVVYHNKKYAYPDTPHFADVSHLNRKFKIKDRNLLQKLSKELIIYRDRIGTLGSKLSSMTAAEIGEYLLKPKVVEVGAIDFISFGKDHVEKLKLKGKAGTAGILNSVINNLLDFFETDVVYTTSISYQFLSSYESFLRKDREQIRCNNRGEYTAISKGLDDGGVFRAITNLNTLFKEARDQFNDEGTGIIRIPHNPFKKYKVAIPPDVEGRDLHIDIIKKIRDLKCMQGGRQELARDMFMLSFYLCGINAVDLYALKEIKNGRINYFRQKTKGKRPDRAFISVKVVKESRPILEKWIGKLSIRYRSSTGLNKAIAAGLRQVAKELAIDKFDYYSARHTVATEARNTLGYSKADVGEYLNHRSGHSITDTYIKKNWSKIDEIQAGVVALLNTV